MAGAELRAVLLRLCCSPEHQPTPRQLQPILMFFFFLQNAENPDTRLLGKGHSPSAVSWAPYSGFLPRFPHLAGLPVPCRPLSAACCMKPRKGESPDPKILTRTLCFLAYLFSLQTSLSWHLWAPRMACRHRPLPASFLKWKACAQQPSLDFFGE